MIRILRSPAVLMTVCAGLFLYSGPWFALRGTAHRSVLEAVIYVVLAALAARGNRPARILLVVCGSVGVWVTLVAGTNVSQPLARLSHLGCYLLEICILISTPMYQRTRPAGQPPGQVRPARFLPVPPLWTALASAGAGVVIVVLHLYHFQALGCPSGGKLAVPGAPCLAYGSGYPFVYRFFNGIFQMRGGNIQWLGTSAPQGIQPAALVADWAIWGLAVLLLIYLGWLAISRDESQAVT